MHNTEERKKNLNIIGDLELNKDSTRVELRLSLYDDSVKTQGQYQPTRLE